MSAAPDHPPAIGVLETSRIARGMVALDAMLKRAPVAVVAARPVTPGKYLVIVAGGEEEVLEAMAAGAEAAGETLLDRLLLAQAHPMVRDALLGTAAAAATREALGILETLTVSSTLVSADAACKAAEVRLCELRLAVGIGGKALFTVTGALDQVQAAMSAAAAAAGDKAVDRQLIARPHEELPGRLVE